MSDVKPIPEGFNALSPYLFYRDTNKAIEFYKKAFGAIGGACLNGPDGTSVMHAEVQIGDSMLMMSDECEQWGTKSAETLGCSPASLHLYVEDADAFCARAIEAGCTEIQPMTDMFWGDRFGKIADPFGYQWGIATHVEDVPDEEMGKRAAEWMASMAEQGSSE